MRASTGKRIYLLAKRDSLVPSHPGWTLRCNEHGTAGLVCMGSEREGWGVGREGRRVVWQHAVAGD